MKKVIMFIQLVMLTGLMSMLGVSKLNAQAISPQFFGQNAWMPDSVGSKYYNGKLHKNWHHVEASGSTVIRYGGTSVDQNMSTNSQYIRMIDSVRKHGMEPMLQVPFDNWKYTAQQAADIVKYVNITKGKNVKLWVIANEPDLAYSFTSASQVASYIKAFSSAMKAVDPTIKIVGPETAWFNQGILDGLTEPNGPNDVTGKDAAGRFYIDVISFHTYPFNGSQSRAQVISKLTSSGGLQDNLIHLNQRIAACNTAHGRTGTSALKTAITEGNIAFKHDLSDNLYGVGTNSFIGGQFLAEMMAVSMKHSVSMFNVWSVIEGGSGQATNIGYIDPVTGNRKPLYWHYKMMADHFNGTYVNGTTNQPNVKAFASKNGAVVTVMLMNQDMTNSFNYALSLNSTAIPGATALKVNVDAGVTGLYTETLPAQSTVLLVFRNGQLEKKLEYSLNEHAAANQPPVETQFGITTGVNEQGGAPQARKDFGIQKIFPIPAVGSKFTLEVEKGDDQRAQEFQVQLFNIVGQEVYNKKLKFEGGREEIELNPAIASGEYLVRVKEGAKENFQVRKILIQK